MHFNQTIQCNMQYKFVRSYSNTKISTLIRYKEGSDTKKAVAELLLTKITFPKIMKEPPYI